MSNFGNTSKLFLKLWRFDLSTAQGIRGIILALGDESLRRKYIPKVLPATQPVQRWFSGLLPALNHETHVGALPSSHLVFFVLPFRTPSMARTVFAESEMRSSRFHNECLKSRSSKNCPKRRHFYSILRSGRSFRTYIANQASI